MYFKQEGRQNTHTVVETAIQAARERKIGSIVVASCTGETARQFKDLKDTGVVCVTHVYGFMEKGKNEMPEEVRKELQAAGIRVHTAAHVLSGAERGISRKFGGTYPVEITAHTLRMFGQGIKVCVEIAVMALDAGLIPQGEPVIAVAGTGEGADTAVILTPSYASSLFDTRIHEILCKPV